jgi:hypothetical protein
MVEDAPDKPKPTGQEDDSDRPMVERPAMKMFASNLLFILVAFPYLAILPTGSDIQPYALLFASALVIWAMVKFDRPLALPRPVWLMSLILLYAGLVYLTRSEPGAGLRSLAGYASVFILTAAGYKTFRYLKPGVFLFSFSIWAVTGAVQFFYQKEFAKQLLVRMSTSPGRGVTGLAVEPSYYAIMCMFFLFLNEALYHRHRYGGTIYHAVNGVLYFQIFISFSGMGMVFLGLLFGARIVGRLMQRTDLKQKVRSIVPGVLLCGFVMLYVFIPSFRGTRSGRIFEKISSDPVATLFTDASISDRASHIVLSFYSLAYSHGLGLGLGTWSDRVDDMIDTAGGWVARLARSNPLTVQGSRIMSGWGSAVYELGAVGLLYMVLFWGLILKLGRGPGDRAAKTGPVLNLLILFFLVLAAVPLATPFFGYLLGMYFYMAYAEDRNGPARPQDNGCPGSAENPSGEADEEHRHLSPRRESFGK